MDLEKPPQGQMREQHMKLPLLSQIEDPQMRFLYECDMKELFNPNERNPIRFCYQTKLNLILDLISQRIRRCESVIDVGCAQGNYTLSIAGKGIYSVGVDLRRQFLKYAKMKAGKDERANADFIVANAEYLPFRSGSVDCIILGELLEHLSEPTKVLDEVRRLLKARAFSIISTPNAECFGSARKRTYANIIVMPRDALDRLKFAPATHVFEFAKEEFLALLTSRFEVLYFKYLWLAPLTSLPYRIPIPSKIIRRSETEILNIPGLGQKLARDMVCMITPHRYHQDPSAR